MQQGGKTSTQRLLLPPGAVERGSAVAAQAAHYTSCPLPLHGSGLPHLNSLRETLTEQHIYLLSCISHCQFAGLRLGLAPGLVCGGAGGAGPGGDRGSPGNLSTCWEVGWASLLEGSVRMVLVEQKVLHM